MLQTGPEGPQGSEEMYYAYQTATVIINYLFLVNFAVNFVLYCVVNVQFRRTARDVICCACSSLGRQKGIGYRGVNDSRRVMSVTGTAVTGLQSIPMRSCSPNKRDAVIAHVDVM